jgi:hypothetical protein
MRGHEGTPGDMRGQKFLKIFIDEFLEIEICEKDTTSWWLAHPT